MKEIILVDNSNFHYKGITYTKDDIKEKIGKKVKFIEKLVEDMRR